MPATLLRHHYLSFKNRLRQDAARNTLGRDIAALLILSIMIFTIYAASDAFLERLRQHPNYDVLLVARLVDVTLLAFFMLLLFSSSIAALGILFAAKDMPLLLTAPVPLVRIYAARLLEVLVSSSWMFVLLTVPALLGMYTALSPHWSFIPVSLAVLVPYLLIPAALAGIVIVLFVNLVPPHRIRDVLVLSALSVIGSVLFFHYRRRNIIFDEQRRLDEVVQFLHGFNEPSPLWLPSTWTGDIVISFVKAGAPFPWAELGLLVSAAAGLTALGYLLFDMLFLRGWGISVHVNRTLRVRRSHWSGTVGQLLVPFNAQLRALLFKEARMFLRDTTQSLQLVLLLMLTFIYLYNFRALRGGFSLPPEGMSWWQAVLALANMSFGACVVSAISARFVFPSVSLEGRAYTLLRATPLSQEQFLRHKFHIWLIPMCIMSVILFVSGTWAIFATPETVIVSAVLAVALTIGTTGLAVGIGAVYAKFDWESPAQVNASFGSLVYMLLSLALVAVTMLPSMPIFILTSVPTLAAQMDRHEYTLVVLCSLFLVFYVNYAVCRHALNAGAQHLKEMEN